MANGAIRWRCDAGRAEWQIDGLGFDRRRNRDEQQGQGMQQCDASRHPQALLEKTASEIGGRLRPCKIAVWRRMRPAELSQINGNAAVTTPDSPQIHFISMSCAASAGAFAHSRPGRTVDAAQCNSWATC